MKKDQAINFLDFKKKPAKFLFFVSGEKKWFGVTAVIFVIMAVTTAISIPILIGKIVDAISEFKGDMQAIYLLVFLLIGAMTLVNVFFRLSGFLASWWITYMEIFSTQIVFDYLLQHSARFFSSRLSGKLQNKIFNIANAINSIFPILLWNFLTLLVKLISVTILAFSVNFIMGMAFVVFILVAIVFNSLVSPRIARYAKIRAEYASETRGLMVDVISNILAVKQNVTGKKESKRMRKSLKKYRRAHLNVWRYFEGVLLSINFIIALMIGAFIFLALHLWQQGMITLGEIVMLLTILLTLFHTLEFLSDSFNRFMEHFGKMKEGLEEIFIAHEIKDKPGARKAHIKKGEIIFNRVNFHYKEDKKQAVFKDLSLTIPAGQKIGLVGESGAGKTTLASLILRFMDVDSGRIFLDGYDIKTILQDDLRRAIAYVPQEALLFHRTLKENIKYGYSKANYEDMLRATRRAYALDFINLFPKKFHTLVGERGIKLSGGQKQRVMIARAMLKKSPILILDEATSSLDSHSEKLIQKALGELMKNRTTLVIAHRLSTLKKMDRIIVFDDGKIVEDGTHQELLANKSKYYELWQYQSGAE